MGLFGTLTKSPEGILFLIVIGSLVAFGIVFIFAGDWIIDVMGRVLLQTIIPGFIMVLGIFLGYTIGIKQKKSQWILFGFIIFVFGFVLAAIMGAF